MDEDYGAFFIKFCSYFPYPGKLCINGHEYLKGQLARRGIEFEALDNGLLRCGDPAAAQRIAEAFDEKKIERFFRKWLSVLPHPYPAADRKAGFRYRLSVLRASALRFGDARVQGLFAVNGAGRLSPAADGLLSTHLCQNHPPGPLRYPKHLLPSGPANGSRLP